MRVHDTRLLKCSRATLLVAVEQFGLELHAVPESACGSRCSALGHVLRPTPLVDGVTECKRG
jgi:hypothetical protein